jgi:hypothetical protein
MKDTKIDVMPHRFRIGKLRFPFFLILTLLIIGAGLFVYKVILPDQEAFRADWHFKGCKLAAKDCIDIAKCDLNSYCGDGVFQDCRVYDCGSTYGIFTQTAAGKVAYKNETKLDEQTVAAAVAKAQDECSGTMQILSQECKEGKGNIKLQMNTKGKCEIESIATLAENSGAVPNTFTHSEDNIYYITTNNCGKITQVIPAAKGGIELHLQQVGA